MVSVELHNPTRLDGVNCIEQEPDVGEVDIDYLILSLDVLSDKRCCIQRHAIWIVWIIVALQCYIEFVLLPPHNELT